MTLFEKFIKYQIKIFDICDHAQSVTINFMSTLCLPKDTELYQLLITISFTGKYYSYTIVSLQAIWLQQIAINLYVDIMRVRAANANHDRYCFKLQIEMISQPCRDS